LAVVGSSKENAFLQPCCIRYLEWTGAKLGLGANANQNHKNWSDEANIKAHGFNLDEIAKAFDYIKRKLAKAIHTKRVCFWVIGNANGMSRVA
jgi:hypothetical protein